MAVVTAPERLAWFQSARNVTLSVAQLAFLDTIQPWVENVVARVVGYDIEQGTVTEFLPSPGGERPPLEFGIDVGWDRLGGVVMPRSRMDPAQGVLQLSRLPVRSVTSVYENLAAWTTGAADGDWPAAALLPAGAYRLDMDEPGLCKSGRLVRTVGSWLTTPRGVKVTYVAGYTAGELAADMGAVKMAVLMGLGYWWGKSMRLSAGIRGNMTTALNLAVRDFSVALGDPSQMGAGPGPWAQGVLGPESLAILVGLVNMGKWFR